MYKKTSANRNLIIMICLFCPLFLKCGHDNLIENTDSKVNSMLKKLPSEYERGNISIRDGRLLYNLIVEKGYRHGLEIGTSNGYSALWQGLAFRQNNGRLLTIEIDPIAGREAQENFIEAGLNDLIDLKIDDAKNVLGNINETFDFVFVDTGNSSLDFFSLAYPFVSNGGTIVIHNVNKSDPRLKTILNLPELNATLKSHLFYCILICTKKSFCSGKS